MIRFEHSEKSPIGTFGFINVDFCGQSLSILCEVTDIRREKEMIEVMPVAGNNSLAWVPYSKFLLREIDEK